MHVVCPGVWCAVSSSLQAYACVQAYNSSTACKAKPYCVWEYDSFDQREVCLHRDTAARGTDAFSQELGAIRVRGSRGGGGGWGVCVDTGGTKTSKA